MPQLEKGEKVPYFEAEDQDGNLFSSVKLAGKKYVIYFYPRDNTPGCTTQACNLRDNYMVLKKKGFEIFGVSTDDVRSHKKFAEKYKLPFTLLADVDKKLVNTFGVYGEKKFMGRKFMGTKRTTFIVNEEGKVEDVITDVKTAHHAEQITG